MEGNHHAHKSGPRGHHLWTPEHRGWWAVALREDSRRAGARSPSSFYTTASSPGSHRSPRKKEGQENGGVGRLQQPAPWLCKIPLSALSKSSSQVSRGPDDPSLQDGLCAWRKLLPVAVLPFWPAPDTDLLFLSRRACWTSRLKVIFSSSVKASYSSSSMLWRRSFSLFCASLRLCSVGNKQEGGKNSLTTFGCGDPSGLALA